MAQGLPVSDIVDVDVVISPRAAAVRNFGTLMVLGSSDVIDMGEMRRTYTTYEAVLADFSSSDPEALFANLFFSQSPQPNILYIGRWAQAATKGVLRGGVLAGADKLMSNFTGITTGSLSLTTDGVARNLTGLNFSAAGNLNAVANIIQTALAAVASGSVVQWDANSSRFTVKSGTTGIASTVGYSTTPGAGTDIGTLLKLKTGQASVPVAGVAAEGFAAAVERVGDQFTDWYGLAAATATPPSNSDHLAAAAYVEAANTSRIYGATITSSTVLDPTDATDLGSQLKALGYKNTVTQYSSNPYAIASFLGRAFTVDFTANNSTITMKFKQEPGVAAERLTATQARALKDKNVNVFVSYNNDTAIIQEGVMANGYYFDEVHGLHWLQNTVQTNIFNLLYQSLTKVPQTDDGFNQIVNEVNRGCIAGVNNGLIAAGQWNADGFGSLRRGDTLKSGFYTYCPPAATQNQADREARKTPLILCAAKLAGAVHFANVRINVNR